MIVPMNKWQTLSSELVQPDGKKNECIPPVREKAPSTAQLRLPDLPVSLLVPGSVIFMCVYFRTEQAPAVIVASASFPGLALASLRPARLPSPSHRSSPASLGI